MRYPAYLALRYLAARKTSWFAAVAIALSTATVLTVLYVLWGLSHEIQKQARGALPDLTVQFSSGYGLTDYEPLLARLRNAEGVAEASAVLSQWALIERDRHYVPAQVIGVDLPAEMGVVDLARWCGGTIPSLGGDPPGVLVGWQLAEVASLYPGGDLRLVSAVHSSPSSPVPTYLTLGRGTFRTAGTFRSWDFTLDRYAVMMALAEAQRLFRRYRPAAVSEARARLREGADLAAARDDVERIVREADPFARIYTWREMSAQGLALVDAENRVMAVILSMILIAVCFSIAVILSGLVREKTRDIGILKACGATTGGVARLFLLCGGGIGLSGATAGVAISLFIARHIDVVDRRLQEWFQYDFAHAYRLERMPVHVDAQAVAAIWGLAFGVSLLASLLPAWRASRLTPVETLRYE